MTEWVIDSEVGRLDAMLVHRPGLELSRITPRNKDELLFDELLWVEQAQAEHDAFVDLLRLNGTEVLELADLLADVLADPELAARVIAAHATDQACGPVAGPRVRAHLARMLPRDVVMALLGGVAIGEVDAGGGLVAAVGAPGTMLLDPLPNAVFVRDSSAWIGDGVVVSPMNRLVRRRESALLRLVVTRHPRFVGAPLWLDEADHFPASFEGGDLLVVGHGGVAIGMSQRTTPSGVETLAARLLAAGAVERILAVELPRTRATMHLDTVVTQVDVDAFLTYPSMTRQLRCHPVTADGAQLRIAEPLDLPQGLAWAAGREHVRLIEPSLGSVRAEREQWNDANNTLALRPGEVIAYDRNVATNEALEAAGIGVRTMPSGELPRGRGGPRCMSCPLRRRPVP